MLNPIIQNSIYLPSIGDIADFTYIYKSIMLGLLLIFIIFVIPKTLRRNTYNTVNVIVSNLLLVIVLSYYFVLWYSDAELDQRYLFVLLAFICIYTLFDRIQSRYFQLKNTISPEVALRMRNIIFGTTFTFIYLFFIISGGFSLFSLNSNFFWSRIGIVVFMLPFIYYVRKKYFFQKPILGSLASLGIIISGLIGGYIYFLLILRFY